MQPSATHHAPPIPISNSAAIIFATCPLRIIRMETGLNSRGRHKQSLTIRSYLGHRRLKYTPVKCPGQLVKNHLTESPSLPEHAWPWGRYMEDGGMTTEEHREIVGSFVIQKMQKGQGAGSIFRQRNSSLLFKIDSQLRFSSSLFLSPTSHSFSFIPSFPISLAEYRNVSSVSWRIY